MDGKKLRAAEKSLEAAVMQMVDGIPMEVPCSDLGATLLETLSDGDRTPDKQLTMLASALAAALKIIKRSEMNTPTTGKSDTP